MTAAGERVARGAGDVLRDRDHRHGHALVESEATCGNRRSVEDDCRGARAGRVLDRGYRIVARPYERGAARDDAEAVAVEERIQ